MITSWSALAGGETCTEMNRTLEHFEVLQLVKNETFVSFIDVPFKVTPHGLEHYKNQITKKVLEPLH
ncbi:MAG: 2-hydroxyacyl-CoA dehydratase family protein [Oscillospiraceae bacterium]